jgi:hypothetical protein
MPVVVVEALIIMAEHLVLEHHLQVVEVPLLGTQQEQVQPIVAEEEVEAVRQTHNLGQAGLGVLE